MHCSALFPAFTAAQLKEAKYSLSGPQWATISVEAKRFVRALMTLDPAQRLDVHEALRHEWMRPPSETSTASAALQASPAQELKATPGGSQRTMGEAGLPRTSPCSVAARPTQAESAPLPLPVPVDANTAALLRADEVSGSDPPVTRRKSFCPVFWSVRKQISATLSGAIPCGGAVPATTQAGAGDDVVSNQQPTHGTVSKTGGSGGGGGGGGISGWYEPVQCCESEEDIDEFSSDDDSGTPLGTAPRILGGRIGVAGEL